VSVRAASIAADMVSANMLPRGSLGPAGGRYPQAWLRRPKKLEFPGCAKRRFQGKIGVAKTDLFPGEPPDMTRPHRRVSCFQALVVSFSSTRLGRRANAASRGYLPVRSRKWPRFTVDGSRAAAGALGAHGFNGLLIVPRQTYARAYASASASTSVRN
jgi:hypothetical protein